MDRKTTEFVQEMKFSIWEDEKFTSQCIETEKPLQTPSPIPFPNSPYTSNFNPSHITDFQSSTLLYHPSGFSNGWNVGEIPYRGTTMGSQLGNMGFLSSARTVPTDLRPENSSLPSLFQQQHNCSIIDVNDLIPKKLSEGNSSKYVEPLKEEINIFSLSRRPEPEEKPPADNDLKLQGKSENSYCNCTRQFDIDKDGEGNCLGRILTMGGLERNEVGKKENESSVCVPRLTKIDIWGGGEHKVFDESSLRTCETNADVPSQAIDVSQSCIELETTTKSIKRLVVVSDQTSYDTTTTLDGYPLTYCELQVMNLESKCSLIDSVVPYQVRALETLVFSIVMIEYDKEDNPFKLVLVYSVCPTKEGKTHVLNVVEEENHFLVINRPTIKEKRVTTMKCFPGTSSTIKECRRLNLSQLRKEEERRRQKNQSEEMLSYELEGLFNTMTLVFECFNNVSAFYCCYSFFIMAKEMERYYSGKTAQVVLHTTLHTTDATDRIMAKMGGKPLIDGKCQSLVACHEVGLDIYGIFISGHDLVKIITVITQGHVSGLTLFTHVEKLHLPKVQLFARIVSGLGQKAEEGMRFSELEVTTGDAGLEKQMVKILAMFENSPGSLMDPSTQNGNIIMRMMAKYSMSKMLVEDFVDVVLRISDSMCEIAVSYNDVLANCNSGPIKLVLVAIRRGTRNYKYDIPLWLIKAKEMVKCQGVAGPCPAKSGRTIYFMVPSYCECISLAFTSVTDIKKRLVDIIYENLRHPNQQTHGVRSFMNAYIVVGEGKDFHAIVSTLAARQKSAPAPSFGIMHQINWVNDQIIPWSFPLLQPTFGRLGKGGWNIGNNRLWLLTKGHNDIVASFKQKKYSCLVDWRSRLGQLKHNLKWISKLCNTINVNRDQTQLVSILLGGNIALDFLLQILYGLAMKMILEFKDGQVQVDNILTIAFSVFNVVSFTWFILHVLGGEVQQKLLMMKKMYDLPTGLTFTILGENDVADTLYKSSIILVVGWASEKQDGDVRKRLNVVTLLVLKAGDRKLIDIGLKNISHELVFSLQYDFVKHDCFLLKIHSCIKDKLIINIGDVIQQIDSRVQLTEWSDQEKKTVTRVLSSITCKEKSGLSHYHSSPSKLESRPSTEDSSSENICRVFVVSRDNNGRLRTSLRVKRINMASFDIPTIDVSPFIRSEENEEGKKKGIEQMREACVNYGFFQIANHRIPLELLSRIMDMYKTFFACPDEENLSVLSDNYFKSTKKSAGTYEQLLLHLSSSGFKVCPENPPHITQVLEEMASHFTKLGFVLGRIISECLGLPPNFLANYRNDQARDFLLVIHYSPATEAENIGKSAHKDPGCITTLYQAEVGGLQVHKGEQWIPIEPSKDKLVANIGDVLRKLTVFSNGSCGYGIFENKEEQG
ncbi:hypothetical protein H5410_018408 [Solanum commersonii]|uniref:Uncharacterized protein n=1 Tax=Solanum commersonii TaxID=4109 RepID=A0A9J6A2C7_SOLCO|nr:hypothetical protein H5410_018408 [Solanum commersonii]